ncbi:elongation factor G [bacterium]|nr:elongation factor G [bacterium]
MKEYSPSAIRNVGLIGHGSCGKTSLAEAMLFTMKAIERMGSVDEGSSHSDFMKEEIERGSSISASLLSGEHNKFKFNIIDTPGFSDFSGEVRGALSVVDFALTVIHGVAGIEVVTEQVWEYAQEEELPRGFFVNMMDKENANYDRVLEMLESRFGNTAILEYAVNPGPNFDKVLDILNMKLLTFSSGGKVEISEIPGDLQDKANELREALVERAAEADDALLEKFFEEMELSDEDLRKGLKIGLMKGTMYPVMCGAATALYGVAQLLDFLGGYGPSPADVPPHKATKPESTDVVELTCDPTASLAALVFKTTTEAHVGEMSFFRVYSGTLKNGDEAANTVSDGHEKINQMYFSLGKQRNAVDHVVAGDMGVLVKLRNTHTGDTLADMKNPVVLEPPKFPEPSIRSAVISKGSGDEDKIAEGLNTLQKADPTFTITYDPELAQTILSGQGDAQLAVVLSRLKDRFGVEAELIPPKIPYRETIKSTAEAEGKHKKQSGGRGQFGVAFVKLEPRQRGEGYEFVDAIVGGSIPRQFIPAVDKGIQESLDKGVIAGYQFVDVKATVYDGKFHPVDSDEFSFKMAGSFAFREAVKKAKTVILEPIYDVEIKCPEENMGDVMGDISSRRGKVMNMDTDGHWQIIKAKIPLAELYKYANTLRSITSGRGMHRRKFSHYEDVPGDIQAKLIEEYEAKRAEGN